MATNNLVSIASKGGRAANFPGKRRPRLPLTLAAAAAEAAEAIASLENVCYVTVGEKHVAGAPSGAIALIAYVGRKGDTDPAQRIPSSVRVRFSNGRERDIPTDVVELVSPPRLLGMRAGNVIVSADREQGMCGLTFEHQGQRYAATNAHVVSNMRTGILPGQPGVIDPGTQRPRSLGTTLYFSRVQPGGDTAEDLAMIHVTDVPVDPLGLVGEAAPIRAFADFARMPAARFWYNVNGARILLESPQPVVNQRVRITVDRAVFFYNSFWALRIVSGLIAPGHSGSLVCAGNGNQIVACGMLFGGSLPTHAYVIPIHDVWNRIVAHLP